MEISEKEFAIIRAIHGNHSIDQRTIAVKAGISLGLANLLIKRLIKKGYVKARQLNQKKIQYLLTPEGFSEKAVKSAAFTKKTIDLIRSIKHRLHELIITIHEKGVSEFTIAGDNEELADIVEILLHNLEHLSVTCISQRTHDGNQMLCLIYRNPETKTEEKVDLIEYLSNTGMFWQ